MDATLRFELGGREYNIVSPKVLQLATFRTILQSYYGGIEVAPLGEIKSVVDVGACIGMTALTFATIWPEASILAIEPHPILFRYLVKNCEGFPNIHPLNIALSDRSEQLRLALPLLEQRSCHTQEVISDNVGMVSRYGKSDDLLAFVDAVPLDSIVSDGVDYIKIDVEGAEESVLLGAERTLNTYHPVLQVEVRDSNLGMAGSDKKSLMSLLAGFGYRSVGELCGDVLLVHKTRKICYS